MIKWSDSWPTITHLIGLEVTPARSALHLAESCGFDCCVFVRPAEPLLALTGSCPELEACLAFKIGWGRHRLAGIGLCVVRYKAPALTYCSSCPELLLCLLAYDLPLHEPEHASPAPLGLAA